MEMWQYFGLVTNMWLVASVILTNTLPAAIAMFLFNLALIIWYLFAGKGVNHDSN